MQHPESITPAEIAAARAKLPRAFVTPVSQQALRVALAAVLVFLIGWCIHDFDITPARIIGGIGKLGHIVSIMFPPSLDGPLLREAAVKIGETVSMALLGTLIGALIAFPLGFLGAKNIVPLEWVRLSTRRGFDVMRAFEQLVLALIFIRAFGLGPLAGILAIAISDIGTLSKLFAEAIENTDRKPVDGVMAAGADSVQTLRFATLPQVLPVMLSNVLYQLESNTRSATILGIVGAGGIGFLLDERIRAFQWPDVTTIAIVLILTVSGIDWLSAHMRHAIIGKRDTVI